MEQLFTKPPCPGSSEPVVIWKERCYEYFQCAGCWRTWPRYPVGGVAPRHGFRYELIW